MAIQSIDQNEVFQLGQFKAQIISGTSDGGAGTITKALLYAGGKGHGLSFSRIHAMFTSGNANSVTRGWYTTNTVTGRPETLEIVSGVPSPVCILLIGE